MAAMIPYVDIHDVELKLQDVIVAGRWNVILPGDELVQRLRLINPSLIQNLQDAWIWGSSDSGVYSAKEGYVWLRNRHRHDDLHEDWRWLWRMKIPERLRIFLWMVMHESIQTNSYRFKCTMAASPSCTRCSATEEDV